MALVEIHLLTMNRVGGGYVGQTPFRAIALAVMRRRPSPRRFSTMER